MGLPLGFFEFFGFQGFLNLGILGVLLYGERLPEVAAGLGRQLMQLKKAADAMRNEIESVASDAKSTVSRSMERAEETSREEATAPKFEPPPAEPSIGSSPSTVPGEAR